MLATWKNRHELPVIKRLNIRFDIEKLRKELESYSENKVWDSLGSDYASLCETHTRLPKMFFKDEELKNINHVCELDWKNTSYQQLSLTEYDSTYTLNERTEKSNTIWDKKIAKNNSNADERWFRKIKNDVPPYMKYIINFFEGKAHRVRFANLFGNSVVKPHIDYDTTYGIRLHIAITTNKDCYNGGWDKNLNEIREHIPSDGSVWFVNPGVKHYAVNNGNTSRNHLIISLDSQYILNHNL